MPLDTVYSLALSAYAQNMPISKAVRLLCLFALWAFVGRSIACTVNDICDRDIDVQVGMFRSSSVTDVRLTMLQRERKTGRCQVVASAS
jgi:4-hydroxybenzoate polyprenyltransferase